MMALQKAAQSRGNWVRESEHIVVRVVSLVFSVGSAYAIRWFAEPLDTGDPIHYVLWWIVALGFGLLGFYSSRGLMHRMMAGESVWAYVPLFGLIEFFEILCNYAKAVSVVSVGNVIWIVHAPLGQQGIMAVLTYIGWSILPLVSPTMAIADMDMTRRRNGEIAAQQQRQAIAAPQGKQQGQWGGNQAKQPLPRPGVPQSPVKPQNSVPQQPSPNNATTQQQVPIRPQGGAYQQYKAQQQTAGSSNGVNPLPGITP